MLYACRHIENSGGGARETEQVALAKQKQENIDQLDSNGFMKRHFLFATAQQQHQHFQANMHLAKLT